MSVTDAAVCLVMLTWIVAGGCARLWAQPVHTDHYA